MGSKPGFKANWRVRSEVSEAEALNCLQGIYHAASAVKEDIHVDGSIRRSTRHMTYVPGNSLLQSVAL